VRMLASRVVAISILVAGLALPAVGAASAAAAASPSNPKVVVIVGPVGGSTSSYRSDAEAAAVEASKYTTNVVRIYSPTATWTKVRAALQGASIVIYMGHGNGWPSPYAPFQTYTKDGLGLNPSAGTDNSTTKYYGEYYLANDVHLAPNAVVVLAHLCYSAGNSEPGNPDPTLTVAKQRVDNMAAGWVAAGARAVIAEVYGQGLYGGAAWYVRQLFTTHRSIDAVWRADPNFNNHVISYGSTRSSGFTDEMDPDGVNKPPFHRSIVGKLDLQTQDVTGARYAATDIDPTSFVVPGAASVAVDGAGLFADAALTPDAGTGLPPATLPLDTKVRLDAVEPAVGGVAVYAVHTLDGSATGFMAGPSLRPRDSQGPAVWTADAGTGAFSPNGDGSQDTFDVAGQFSESVDWHVAFADADGAVLRTASGSGRTYDATWSGLDAGTAVPDGSYTYTISATDGWGNPTGTRAGVAVVDTVAPAFASPPAPLTAGPTDPPTPTFSPNGDGIGDTASFAYDTDEAGFIDATVRDVGGHVVRDFATKTAAGSGAVVWTGGTDAGGTAPDGQYTVELAPRDLAGNVGGSLTDSVAVYGALSKVAVSNHYFYPQDADAYAKTVAFSFHLARTASVTWTLRSALTGAVIYQRFLDRSLAAGTYGYTWNGKTPAGAWVPRGIYTLTVSATNGSESWTQSTWVYAGAFRILPSTTTPARGQTITVTAVSAEALTAAPRLTWTQPGHSAKVVTMSKASSTSYKVTIKLYASGGVGTLKLSVSGHDHAGHTNTSSISLVLH
jgi:flagellar hook assembly protein FlgD